MHTVKTAYAAIYGCLLPGLAWASDHGVNGVEQDGEDHPENGGEEKTAYDLAYRMGPEEAG
jgi:hypothetical protein